MPNLIPLPDPHSAGPSVAKYSYDSGGDELAPLKKLIWLYFFLLIFEGALRKWIVPSLSNPLLVIRDPVVILIYMVAGGLGVFPKNGFIYFILGLGLVSGIASELAGHGNLLITFYGLRTNFLHLPMIFLIPNVFSGQDIHRLGRWLLILAIPMALLTVAQFRASPDSPLNVGAGGTIGGQMEVSFGKIRPPGTFSFNTGLVDFVALVTAYLISTQMTKNAPHKKLAAFALPATLTMVAVSGSRTSLGVVTIILAGVVFICLRKPVFFGKGMKGLVVLGVAYFALSFWSEFRNGLMVHENRLVTGGGIQQGMLYRILGEAAAPFHAIADTPLFGKGLGMGTNVAAGLLFGERGFLLAESEWERLVRESGPILGFCYIGLRIAILAYLGRRALEALNRENPLPMLIFCAALPEILNGQFAVPTSLGFGVLSAGCSLAAANVSVASGALTELRQTLPMPDEAIPKMRGRSVYAEKLHGR